MPSLQGLLRLSDADLGCIDLAELNLACAVDLPGSEHLDFDACQVKIGALVEWIRSYTEGRIEVYRRNPREFENSANYFRILAMVTVLQRGAGVKYDPERVLDPDFANSQHLFIHGPLFGNGGTCSSLPFLYTAIGRRLKYPLKLVQSNAHIFARWESPGERFNIECTSHGLVVHPDKYYLTWPLPIDELGLRANCFLTSLTPRQELAIMLNVRGHCLEDNNRMGEALDAYEWACRLFPNDIKSQVFLKLALVKCRVAPLRSLQTSVLYAM